MIFSLAACGNSAGRTEPSPAEKTSVEESSAAGSTDHTDNGTAADGKRDTAAPSDKQQEETEASEGKPEEEKAPGEEGSRVLVAYFSATNTTERIAEHIANGLNADIYEMIPEDPYTDADLNYHDNSSRSTIEMKDPSSRPAISGSVEHMEQYDIVFIGYPIWWGEAPRIVSTFVESYDFSGKTVIPFCTSGGSGIGSSGTNLEKLTNGAVWMEGRRLNGSDSQDTVMEWVNSLGLEGLHIGSIRASGERNRVNKWGAELAVSEK